jgi:hypothetical protein
MDETGSELCHMAGFYESNYTRYFYYEVETVDVQVKMRS